MMKYKSNYFKFNKIDDLRNHSLEEVKMLIRNMQYIEINFSNKIYCTWSDRLAHITLVYSLDGIYKKIETDKWKYTWCQLVNIFYVSNSNTLMHLVVGLLLALVIGICAYALYFTYFILK